METTNAPRCADRVQKPLSQILYESLDRTRGKVHDFPIVEIVSNTVSSPAEETQSENEMAMDAREYRGDVERAIEYRLRLDPFQISSPIARLAIDDSRVDIRTIRKEDRERLYGKPEMPVIIGDMKVPLHHVAPAALVAQVVRLSAGRPQSDGQLKARALWKLTVDRKLSYVAAHCGQCRAPLARIIGCVHRDALVYGARVNNFKREAVREFDRLDARLASAGWRAKHTKAQIAAAEDARAKARARKAALQDERKSVVHSSEYGDGVEMFINACGRDLAYCLRLPE